MEKAVSSLKNDDFDTFKQVIKDSGDSSYKYLQNVYSNKYPDNQAVSLALALSEGILENHGVCRVHGGGFAGTIQAFVEDEYVDHYKEEIEKYRTDYEENTKRLNEISTNPDAIEQIAREKYLMKKPNEDIYVFEEE